MFAVTAFATAGKASAPVFVYRQISPMLEGANMTELARQGFVVAADERGNPMGRGHFDWRVPAARQWYLDNIIGSKDGA